MSSSSRAPAPIADVVPRAAVGAEAESATDLDAGVDADAAVGAEAEAREAALAGWLLQQGSVLVGFSGGVDSAYLATLALEVLGATRMLAVIGRSASYPASQWATARAVADRFGIPVLEVDTDELNDPRYAANPVNRCYFCKTELWDRLAPIAEERGLAVVIDGTNADDLGDYRPGAAAAREHGVRSPMADVGLTKRDIRALSARRGIPTWSQPSSPCLSSRLPYGTAVTPARLAQVERAEAALRALGVSGDLRVRHHGELARVELGADELAVWLEPASAARVASAVRGAGFARVAIDLADQRGDRGGRYGKVVDAHLLHDEQPTSRSGHIERPRQRHPLARLEQRRQRPQRVNPAQLRRVERRSQEKAVARDRGLDVAAERREAAPRIDQHQRRSLRRGEIREDRPRLLCHRLDDAFGASAPVVGHPIEVTEHRGTCPRDGGEPAIARGVTADAEDRDEREAAKRTKAAEHQRAPKGKVSSSR